MGAGHGHSHGEGQLHIPRELRRALLFALVPVVLAVAVGLTLLWPSGDGPDLEEFFGGGQDLIDGTVLSAVTESCEGSAPDSGSICQHLRVRLDQGPDTGHVVEVEAGGAASAPRIEQGDQLVMGFSEDDDARRYYFADFDRDSPMLLLVVLFAAAAIGFGRISGLRALAALAASLLALVWFVIPSVLDGHSPLAVSIVGSAFIMLAVLYVTGGFNAQTTVTVLGTMASLALIAVLAWGFVEATTLTGLADEDAVFLSAAASSINLQGLLLGGIIIGSLGVLDDMTVTQVSAVWELRRANAGYDTRTLYRSAARVGRDHIASTVNTLVLAYAGASLPLMIYFTQSQMDLGRILTSEVIAVEVVRTLVGSIGLIASVPITTALAAYVVTRPRVESEVDTEPHDHGALPPTSLPVGRRLNRGLTTLNDRLRQTGRPDPTGPSAPPRPSRAEPWRPPRHEREFREPPPD